MTELLSEFSECVSKSDRINLEFEDVPSNGGSEHKEKILYYFSFSTQRTRYVDPVSVQCWSIVYGPDPTLG